MRHSRSHPPPWPDTARPDTARPDTSWPDTVRSRPGTGGWQDAIALPGGRGWIAQALAAIHRPLRLIMAAAIAGAGLCLVLALITLVVAIGNGSPSAVRAAGNRDAARSAAQRISGPGAERSPATAGSHAGGHAPATVPGTVLVTYRGTGSARRGPFRVPAPGEWDLSWTFDCTGKRGTFAVSEAGTSPALLVRAAGPGGSGIVRDAADAGRHDLVIRTGCAWVVKVVLPHQP